MRKKIYISALILSDAVLTVLTLYAAGWLRFEAQPSADYLAVTQAHMPVAIGIMLLLAFSFRLYHRLWRYAGIDELCNVCLVSGGFAVCLFFYDIFILQTRLSYSIYLLYAILGSLFIGMSRLLLRLIRRFKYSNAKDRKRVLIVGAGDAGAMIAREIQNTYVGEKELAGFIDDDPYKSHRQLFGVDVLGNRDEIFKAVEKHKIDEIIIAMPSADGRTVRQIANECKRTACTVKILPGLYELIDGKVGFSQLREISLEDLLRREPIKLDMQEITGYIRGRTVLVTGAGGSIGSELCRQISQIGAKRILLLGRGENSIYEIHQELKTKYSKQEYNTIIADVRNKKRLERIFETYKPEVVFHAAAHKHVPLMEMQPEEAIENNVFGTKNVAECADTYGCERFVLISSDKAVNPTSVMGATKRVAELILQDLNGKSLTKFITVRFGNVLGSRGSVVPLFKKQIASGGPITITHPEMTRYFMTIPEAVQLVLEAGAFAEGGEVFVLDMGEPVKILDMAKDLIELHGLELGKDIQIAFTGLRPGEKLYEELLTAEEGTKSTKHEKIFTARIQPIEKKELINALREFKQTSDAQIILQTLKTLIPTYRSEQLEQVQETTIRQDKITKVS